MNQGLEEMILGPPCWLGSEWSLEPRLPDFWVWGFSLQRFYTCSPTIQDMLRKFRNFNVVAKVTIMGFLQIHEFYKYL